MSDAQATGQTECAEAVDYAEVHGFGPTTLLVADGRFFHPKDLGCHHVMDIAACVEGFQKIFILAEVGQHTKLDLAVVGGEQDPVGPWGDESLADLAALFASDGDILEIRLAGT